MLKWKKSVVLVSFAAMALFVQGAYAGNTRPSSGRPLQNGHWLTCWDGGDSAVRVDPFFHRDTPEEQVAAYIPHFSGAYRFVVKDTWEEWVTKSGTSCSHCGETCTTTGTGQNQTRSCSCNFCSWQELETFYRPWSTQTVSWDVTWQQSQAYRQKRQAWIAGGKKKVSHNVSDVAALLEFDPDRPLEYFLFPGEAERVVVDNGGGTSINPTVSIGGARHEYSIQTVPRTVRGDLLCDDQDVRVTSTVVTGKRLVTTTPNSIEFRAGWLSARKDNQGNITDEPGKFEVTDIAAQLYEGQNVFDHYKDTQVKIWLREIDRTWWFDRDISDDVMIGDNHSLLKKDAARTGNNPRVAVFEISGTDLYRTPYFDSPFHLHPGKQFELCAKVLRKNNIYYKAKYLWFFDDWSEQNCSVFTYKPGEEQDLRSTKRRVRDFFNRIIGIPGLW